LGIILLAWLLFRLLRKSFVLLHRGREIGIVACFVLFSTAAAGGQALLESPYWLFFALLVTADWPNRRRTPGLPSRLPTQGRAQPRTVSMMSA
jgi:hypothetical protein